MEVLLCFGDGWRGMKHFITGLLLGLFVMVMVWAFPSQGATLDPLIEYRYIDPSAGEVVKRDAKGTIIRRADVIVAFRRIHPCPSTGLYKGACAGWAIDHVIPLNNSGQDAVYNLQWLPNVLKSGGGKYPKDRWERIINSPTFAPVIMPASGVLTIQ